MLGRVVRSIRYGYSLVREKKKETERSGHWGHVRDEHLRAHPVCEACGGDESLQVHHVMPFHLHPELELDEANLITLCMGPDECHLKLGHGGSFSAYNPHVREDSMAYRGADRVGRGALIESAHRGRLKA